MVNAFLNGLFNLIISIVEVLLLPIDTILNNTLPQFSEVLGLFSNFLNYILSFIPWGLSWFNIPTFVLTFVVLYIIAKLTISSAVHIIKLALAWWRTLMP